MNLKMLIIIDQDCFWDSFQNVLETNEGIASETLSTITYLEVHGKSLWNEIVPLNDLIKNLVALNSRLEVTH